MAKEPSRRLRILKNLSARKCRTVKTLVPASVSHHCLVLSCATMSAVYRRPTLVGKWLSRAAPWYLVDTSTPCPHQLLRSASHHDLLVPPTRLVQYAQCSFTAFPAQWHGTRYHRLSVVAYISDCCMIQRLTFNWIITLCPQKQRSSLWCSVETICSRASGVANNFHLGEGAIV